MPGLFDYAALSATVYNNARGTANLITNLPSGWIPKGYVTGTGLNGFTAGAYQNGSDIVIAFKGTDAAFNSLASALGSAADLAADLALGAGLGSVQLAQAARFYQEVKAANPEANITFTGHSLGGGIASVLSVWFNRPATTFDEAPFEVTALNPITVAGVSAYLGTQGYVDAQLLTYLTNPPVNYGIRESQVANHFVKGEFLEFARAYWPTVLGTDNPITIGGGSSLSGIQLHSMNLAAALLMQDKLRADTVLLPNFLPALFDSDLYANDLGGNQRDFLTALLNDQIQQGYANPNGNLAEFATDIEKLAQGGLAQNNSAINKGLIAAAMEYYYFKDPAASSALFAAVGNGLHFKYSDIGANSYKSLALLARAAESLSGAGIYEQLIKQDAWHIQSGSTAMNWAAMGNDNDAVIGGDGNETLNGGAGRDILIGGGGDDTLKGEEGNDALYGGGDNDTLDGGLHNDWLEGGAGTDTYRYFTGDGIDVIQDTDGLGQIQFNADTLSGGKSISDNVYLSADGKYRGVAVQSLRPKSNALYREAA